MGKDDFLPIAFAGGIGYLLGENKYTGWDQFIKKWEERHKVLATTRIAPPIGFITKNKNFRLIYKESINCYLAGITNAGLASIVRFLELGLKEKYLELENSKADGKKLIELINWAESRKLTKEKAHNFRMLRNSIHTKQIIEEQDLLEAMRHISICVSELFPSKPGSISAKCAFCGFEMSATLNGETDFIGNKVEISCDRCKKKHNLTISI